MVKVCHMTSAHNSNDVRIFYKECTSLAAAGYETYLVSRGDSREENGVHVVGLGEAPASRRERMTTFAKAVYQKALSLDCEIYHLHDPELLPYGVKLKKQGKKVIFDSHEFYEQQIRVKPYLHPSVGKAVAKAYSVYEHRVFRKIDAVIFPCLIDGVHPFEGMCSHLETLNNVPLLGELFDHYDSSVKKYEKSVCYVGGLTHNRGITHLIKATSLSNVTVYLAGEFSPESYEKEIKEMPEYKNVKYLGRINREEIVSLLSHCQIGASNLLNVGQHHQGANFATKVYEYMAMGMPVILTDAPYNRKVNEKYQFAILVDPENIEEISTAINYLLDHPEEARRMGENGRRAVKEEFNWGIEEKKLLMLYESLLCS